jgi:preprotein translocase subunit SecE
MQMSESAVEPQTEETAGVPPKKVERATRFGERGVAGANVFGRTAQFLRDVRAEMKRVSWPTLNEVRNTTIITLIAVIFFATYLFLVDRVWAFLIDRLRNLLGG